MGPSRLVYVSQMYVKVQPTEPFTVNLLLGDLPFRNVREISQRLELT